MITKLPLFFREPKRLLFTCSIVASLLAAASLQLRASDCSKTSTGSTPLMDLVGSYQGAEGGLYLGGGNAIPTAHLAAGMNEIQQIVPRDAAGQPAANGKIGLVTIGMSNTSIESATFVNVANASPYKNPAVVLVNGAQGGQDAATTSNPNAAYWNFVDTRVTAANLTNQQVQAVWIKQAVAGVNLPFPQDANQFKGYLTSIVQILKSKFPNLRACYISSRIYAGYATTTLNPEPYSYQSAFGVKGLITDQINGNANLNFDSNNGPVVAPWCAWGPYLWADGILPRSDGLTWICGDFNNDGTHPNSAASQKVTNMLLSFFLTSATTAPWFTTNTPACATTAMVSFYGTGLAGASGIPNISSSAPRLGGPNAWGISINNAPPGSTVYFVFGFLPYPDGALAFAGGWQHVLDDLVLTATANASGIATISFGVLPNSVELCGLHLFAQGATEDPAAPQGFGLTRGIQFRLGL
ncbi:MAG: hypothetical protein ACKVS6_12750 [Planctomycetota bacterium]